MALKRHKHHLNNRYVETYKAKGDDFVNVAGGNNNEAQAFLTKGAQAIVRMRGLPYDCTAKQVIEFFESGNEENSCKVMDGEDGVLFVKKPDGRATGDAFVLFANEDDVSKALSKHRESIGTRYIELFRSTTAEVQQVLNRTMETAAPSTQVQAVSYAIPQHVITSGTRKDCIRLRGLPYEASVEHVLEFLGEHAKNILLQGVHMVYNSQGHPSGEAFIQMDSEYSAFAAAQMRHHRFMIFGKKQRYIEVFQCSGEDMSHFLFGGVAPSQTPLSPVGKPLLSPGNTILTAPHFAPAHSGYGLYGPPPPPPTMLARPPPPSPMTPTFATTAFTPMLYWAYPSPPVSPPHQPALVVMQNSPPPPPPAYAGHHDVSNLVHSASDWNMDYFTPYCHQFSSLSLNAIDMHWAAA